jgi:tRNA modification GTPase
MDLEDTIVAVSSPAGAGERAILRLSGPRAMAIAEQVFVASPAYRRGLVGKLTHTALAGRLEPPGSGLSVPALVYLMRAPRSYTRQDVVEFHVGAWPAIEGDLVAGLVAAGARPAEPGEFTFRALMSGRLDLAQAEAVMAVVMASSAAALRAAGDLLGGHLSREIAGLADQVRQVLALVEVGLDFSDQDIEIISHDELASRLSSVRAALADLGRRSRGLETFSGRVRLVLAGRPGAGKSSLFNRLLAADPCYTGPVQGRAIVSPEAGTTRDEVRAALHVGGLVFDLSDIAGLDGGAASDELSTKAQAKALEALGRADLVVLVLEATAPSYEGTDELLALVAAPLVVAVTKCDLAPPDRAMAYLEARGLRADAVATSAVTSQGIEALRAALVRTVEGGAVDRQAAGPVVTARHRVAMEQAAGALARASRRGGRRSEAGELVAVELHEALDALGAILGRRVDGDVLAEIFSQFCIGK